MNILILPEFSNQIKNKYLKIFVLSCIIFILSASLFIIQNKLDISYPDLHKIEDLKYLPSGKFLKGAALAYDELLADLLWIKAIGYFGHHAMTDRDYEWLYHIIDITTILDPYYQDPYEFGGIVLATEIGDIDLSIAILKKGMKDIPKSHKRYWYLPFYLAFDYMYYKQDYLNAVRYLKEAAKIPGSPQYLPRLIARIYANINDPDVAITFLREMINSTGNKELKAQLEKRIKEVIVDRDIRMLEVAIDEFNAKLKRFPINMEELLQNNFIKSIPKDPFGGSYYISQDDHSVQSFSGVGKLELKIDKKGMDIGVKVSPKN